MKHTVFAALLAMLGTSALAGWTQAIEGGEYNTYVDTATISKAGNRVTMWYLTDYKSVHQIAGYKHLSYKSQFEYDCKEAQVRTLATSLFSGNMGGGQLVISQPRKEPGRWLPIGSGSNGEALWNIACGK